MCHAPYLINLAGTDPLTVERSEAVLAQALRTTRGLGALAVIVHLGSHLGSGFDAGLERAAPALERVLELAGDGTWSCSRTRPARAARWVSRSRSWRS